MRLEEPLFRPPAEADSLIFQVTRGCPHNRCTFCGMYKGVPHRLRPLEELRAEIRRASGFHPGVRRIFLADGDAMAAPYDHLREILRELAACFPRLARVNLYANGSSILRKTDAELRELAAAKLDTLYLGLETGSHGILKLVHKDENPVEMAKAVHRARSAGLKSSVMILIGLGGRSGSPHHVAETAAILNRMQPELLSALRLIPLPGLPIFPGFEELTEFEAVAELHSLLSQLELERTVFRANHTSNPMPLAGRFPKDKTRLLAELAAELQSGRLDRHAPGLHPSEL